MRRGAALDAEVERLYRAFAHCEPPARLQASPLRDADAVLRALRSAPLRALGRDQVLDYGFWAMTTVDGPDTYRHFLPRILELALDNPPHVGAEPSVIAGKLDLAGWRAWPAEERLAVRTVFLAAWAWALNRDQAEWDAVRWLVGLAVMGGVADALDAWRRSPSPHAAGHLASLVCYERKRLRGGGIVGNRAFWSGAAPGVREEVTAWMRGADVRRWLNDAATAARPGGPSSSETAWLLSEASSILCSDPDLPPPRVS